MIKLVNRERGEKRMNIGIVFIVIGIIFIIKSIKNDD